MLGTASRPPLAGVLVACALLASAAVPPTAAMTTVRVASGLDWPIYGTAPPGDPRLFIVEQPGFVRILDHGQILPVAFLDIDSLVINTTGDDERGLLGLAFHPDYPDSPYVYVDYVSNANSTVIARYTCSADPDRIDHSTGRILLTIPQPYTNHKGGTVAFGPDGYLYIGMGDGGSGGDPQNRAQNGQELLGKMLRIDVNRADPGLAYAIPPTNPFVHDAGFRDEIWAYGFRNPYRWSFDRATGDLWIGDVGQNLWEEVDFQPAGDPGGEDYGWRLMEGFHCYNPPTNCGSDTLKLPIHEYDHLDLRCAITGGFVYRGDSIPSVAGAYFFADFCSGQIWTLRYDGSQVTELVERTAELAPGGGLSIVNPAGFGQDGFGELYILCRGGGTDGEVYKIVASSTDVQPPPAPALAVSAVAPNPFSDAARFTVTLGVAGPLEVEVLDVAGRLVAELASGERPAGSYPFVWDGRDRAGRRAPSGAYVLRVARDGQEATRRLSLVR